MREASVPASSHRSTTGIRGSPSDEAGIGIPSSFQPGIRSIVCVIDGVLACDGHTPSKVGASAALVACRLVVRAGSSHRWACARGLPNLATISPAQYRSWANGYVGRLIRRGRVEVVGIVPRADSAPTVYNRRSQSIVRPL